jgi:hypothetical protein
VPRWVPATATAQDARVLVPRWPLTAAARLPLVEVGGRGKDLVDVVGLQGLAELGHQLHLAPPQHRPGPQPDPPA